MSVGSRKLLVALASTLILCSGSRWTHNHIFCLTRSESESELLYDWRFTANLFVLAKSPLRLTTSNFIFQLNTCGYSPYVTSSLTRGPHFTVSYSRLPQPGGPGPRIYIPQEQGGPVMPPGTGFPFRRLLRLAGLRWRYSTPPQHGNLTR
jgi:hypothetical protein